MTTKSPLVSFTFRRPSFATAFKKVLTFLCVEPLISMVFASTRACFNGAVSILKKTISYLRVAREGRAKPRVYLQA